MALVKCKERKCPAMVSGEAKFCPACGIKDPAVSYEEEQLISRIRIANEEVDFNHKRAGDHYESGWFIKLCVLIFGESWTTKAYRERANNARESLRELESELHKLQSKRLYG